MSASKYTACEGSNLVGHAVWSGGLGALVACQMCSAHFSASEDHPDRVPEHNRYDIMAMIAAHFDAVDNDHAE